MKIKLMLPELNDNQLSMLRRELLGYVEDSKVEMLPIAFIKQKIEELFE